MLEPMMEIPPPTTTPQENSKQKTNHNKLLRQSQPSNYQFSKRENIAYWAMELEHIWPYRLSNLGDLVEMMKSKKMQKYILKQQFEGFTVSNSDGIHKGYERFQSLLSQLEIHGAGVSTEDANQKFLRSLPSAWLQVSLIMRNKPGMDSLSFDDLYNNLRVFENDVKGSTASSSNLQNIAFVSENTNSTNEVSTAYGVSHSSGHCLKHEQPSTSSYSLLASQSSCPQLDHEDLDQVDEYDLEEMDLKWQVAMISMRINKFQKKTGHFARECRTKEENRRRDGWNTGNREGRRTSNRDESITGKKEESRALVTVDGECVDWTTHSEDNDNYAFMANNSTGSDTQVLSCSNECKESYANIKRLYDIQKEQLSDASVEIKAYTNGLKKVEAQLVVHQQNQLWYEQKIKFMKIDLDDKTDVLTYHKTLLAKAQKEKDDLDVIVHKWNHSSKNLGKIANYSMSARDKFGLGYGDYRYSGNLSYENEVFQSVFSTETSELVFEPVVNESHVEVQPKVWSDAPIIEEYESDSDDDDENVYVKIEDLDTPSFATKHVKTPSENVKNSSTHNCDYHVKLAKQVELHKQNMSKGNGSREKTNKNLRKPIWDNTQRVNKQHQFVTLAVQTRTGNNPVNTVKASGTNYNVVRPQNAFNKTHSLSSRPLKGTTVLRTKLTNQKIYIAKENPHRTLKNKGIIDSGCSRHMTGNKTYLADYQDINGGPVAFGGSRGYITGKGKIQTGIKREYSNARTPQQNGVAERKNRTLIEAARTMLADSFLPNTFWAEAVSTACYVLNRVLVTKPHNKTPYELLTGKGPNWLFDLDYLTDSMNYLSVSSENQANIHAVPYWHCIHSTHHLFFNNQTKREVSPREVKYKSFWMILQDFKGKSKKLMRTVKRHKNHEQTLRKQRFQKLRKMKVGLMLCKKKLLQFEIQKVLFLSRFAFMEEGYGTKWGIGNKKDEEEWLSGTKAD
ncbi:ribonuclease H-like domain-containing protein [Tanacetum coccineum]|uniref:Ribonuclease H-like domain-containing protein n=1 Tax=Tanacetum coccineum TaxID=301880 RepID=A0ABQ5AQ49_9ASTR